MVSSILKIPPAVFTIELYNCIIYIFIPILSIYNFKYYLKLNNKQGLISSKNAPNTLTKINI